MIEPLPASEKQPGMYYAHIPSLGLTTHGMGVDGAMAAAKDLLMIWVEEKRANGEEVAPSGEAILATVEIG